VDKACFPVDKACRSWKDPRSRLLWGARHVRRRDTSVMGIPTIPRPVHIASTAEALVVVRAEGASRMFHTATTTATYSIDRPPKDGGGAWV